MRWRRKRVDLAERLRPYVDVGPPPEPMVDADPIRMFLYRWLIETGDPIEVVARGFDVDVQLLSDILDRRVGWLPMTIAAELCPQMGLCGRCQRSC